MSHQTPAHPISRAGHQQFDPRYHNDYRDDQRNNYYDEQGNKHRPNLLSLTSKQPRGRTAVHWNNERTNNDLNWPTLDRHGDHFDSQDRCQRTTPDHTRTNGNSWNTNTTNETSRNTWNTQSLHTSASRNTGRNSSLRPTSNPLNTNTTNQPTGTSDPFKYVNASPALLKLKELTDIASVCRLFTQEWNQWKVLNTTIPKMHTNATNSGATNIKSPFMGMKQFSVFTWAKTHPKEKNFLNNWNYHFWPKLNNYKNKPDTRHVVNTEMF
jgi:hypothetical protein